MNYIPLKTLPKSASEIQLQGAAWQYLTNTWQQLYGLLFHVPNGGSRGGIEGKQLQAAGVTPGVPDLVLIWRGTVHAIEAKVWDKQFELPAMGCSKEQIAIHRKWATQGIKVHMAFSAEQIVEIVLSITKLTEQDSELYPSHHFKPVKERP